MERPQNIQCFEVVASALLGKMYDSFPRPIHIDCEKLQKELIDSGVMPEHCKWPSSPGSPGMSLFSATMLWLKEEGYVRSDCELRSKTLSNSILTARGFQVLNSPLIESDMTLGSKAYDTIKNGTSFTAGEIMKAIIGAGASAGMSHLLKHMGLA